MAVLSITAVAEEQSLKSVDTIPIPELDCVIEPSEIVDVGSAVPGVVASILADRSDLVKKGAVIAALDSNVEQANLELAIARAGLDTAIELRRQSAKFGYLTQQRNQTLLQKSAISRQEMDQTKTETRIAELQVVQEQENKRIAGLESRRARAVLQQRTIRSPVDGVVMDRFKSVGEYVEDEPLLRVAQLDPLHVEVIVPVEYMGRITPGMQAEVTAVVSGSDTYLATVERVDRVADAASGTYGVRLSLSNPDYKMPAGLRCRLGFLSLEQQQKTDEIAAEKNSSRSKPLNAEPASEPILLASEDLTGACYSIGPLSDENLAQQLSDRLEEQSDGLTMRHETVNHGNRYRVLAAPEQNRRSTQALQARLQAAGFSDLYIMLRGDYKGRVALGYFRDKKTAYNRMRQLADKGFDTEVLPIQKKKQQYWLDLSLKAGGNLSKRIGDISATLPPAVSFKPVACSHLVAHR